MIISNPYNINFGKVLQYVLGQYISIFACKIDKFLVQFCTKKVVYEKKLSMKKICLWRKSSIKKVQYTWKPPESNNALNWRVMLRKDKNLAHWSMKSIATGRNSFVILCRRKSPEHCPIVAIVDKLFNTTFCAIQVKGRKGIWVKFRIRIVSWRNVSGKLKKAGWL